mgnify:CR=1 FL=1
MEKKKKAKNYKEIKKKINKVEKPIVLGRDIRLNRKILENEKVNTLVLQHRPKGDKLKQRVSGLNEVLSKIAKENSITLAISLEELKKVKGKEERARILARMKQNIELIKKYKNEFRLMDYRNKKQAFSFLLTLGLPTSQAKKAIN